jgi:hypothetical protein
VFGAKAQRSRACLQTHGKHDVDFFLLVQRRQLARKETRAADFHRYQFPCIAAQAGRP